MRRPNHCIEREIKGDLPHPIVLGYAAAGSCLQGNERASIPPLANSLHQFYPVTAGPLFSLSCSAMSGSER